MLCKVHFFEKMIFHKKFQVGACPNLKDSSLNERFFYSCAQGMKQSVPPITLLYLRLPKFYKVHFFRKMIFHELFQVGACPNLKDSSVYEMYSIHMYKARSILHL